MSLRGRVMGRRVRGRDELSLIERNIVLKGSESQSCLELLGA